MAGGIGGVIVSKVGGWLFDSYKAAGIGESWVTAKANGLGDYVSRIQSMRLTTKFGDAVSLDKIDLKGLSKEVADQLKNIDAASFDKLLELQKPLVHAQMTTSYTIMFAFCAVAYLIAWAIMKSLVPKYKPITDL
jgi:ACS family hexuronate transporter-like MFS transporter